MELEVIRKAGLSEAQAKTYLALLKSGSSLSPAQISEQTGETRTNTYAILAKLEAAKVVKRSDSKKITYEAAHPSVLETIAEKKRRAAVKNEDSLKSNMSGLLDIFYTHSEKPGVKTFTGYDGIREVYLDVLRTKEPVYLIRTAKDTKMSDFILKYREEMGRNGIETFGIMPDTKKSREPSHRVIDERTLLDRVPMPEGDYTAPVTIMSYGKKVAFVAYGETEMSTIVTSPAIAESLKQIIIMLRNKYSDNH